MPTVLGWLGWRPVSYTSGARVVIEATLSAFAPDVPAGERQRSATVSVHIFGALLPMVLEASEDQRATVVTELKRALLGYVRSARVA